jgi:hypothetical protein
MTEKKIAPGDISHLAESVHEMSISESRAAALAAELEQLNTTARTQSRALAYDVDALGFSGVLQNLKRSRRQG